MKTSLAILIFLITIFVVKTNGQDSIFSRSYNQILLVDVEGTQLEREIVSDTIQFELRLWICNYFFPDKLIQIYKDFDNNWDYRIGYFKYSNANKTFFYQDSLKTIIDWEIFKFKLDSFKEAEIPNQKEIPLLILKDGKTYHAKNEQFFSTIKDGVSYIIEIFNNNTHETIYYNNPHSYLNTLRISGFSTKEHDDFINFIDYLTENFNYNKLQKYQVLEITKTH